MKRLSLLDGSRATPEASAWRPGVRRAPEADTARIWLDSLHPDEAVRRRFGRPGPVSFGAVVVHSGAAGEAPGDPLDGQTAVSFEVEEHPGWWAGASQTPDPTGVVKQISFLCASEGYGPEEFRRHYREHVGVARRHMPSLWQYVQNDVVSIAGPAAAACGDIVAISELWFASRADFLDRYFPSAEDEAAFRSHEGFLDLRRAFSFVATEWVPAAAP